jgi:hypothetical protein
VFENKGKQVRISPEGTVLWVIWYT